MKKINRTIWLIAWLALVPACCKQGTVRDVGIEIAEASDIASMQLERCRSENLERACDDVAKKLDNIKKLAAKLADKAEDSEREQSKALGQDTPRTAPASQPRPPAPQPPAAHD